MAARPCGIVSAGAPRSQFADSVIVITDASSGIGLATAQLAAAGGAGVLLALRARGGAREQVDPPTHA